MDTPLVKILLIAAAIAITVGVTVLAWSIFNRGSAEVSTDQDDRAVSTEIGTRADGVRARIDNARACEALGSAHWIALGTHADASTLALTAGAFDEGANIDNPNNLFDDPRTQTKEDESHCAAGADTRSATDGFVRQVIVSVSNAKDDRTGHMYRTLKLK